MAHAYTPGLKVTERAVIRKTRRLPLLGEVLVKQGDPVTPDMIVAKADIPGNPMAVNVANQLGLEASDIESCMLKKVGDPVSKGERIALYKAFFGLLKKEAVSPIDGKIELISAVTGQVALREPPIPVSVDAYIKGTVVEILPREGVIVETKGAFIQGIFGVGGETQGVIKVLVNAPGDVLEAGAIRPEHAGCIVVGGALITGEALRRCGEIGVKGAVVGGIIDTDLIAYLGYDIGVAITGHEDVPTVVVLTEGFGQITMAQRTFNLLRDLEGWTVSMNGATQIRAGVMRPEIIVPDFVPKRKALDDATYREGLVPGTPIRIIREPYFGMVAEVAELPPELQIIGTESKVRILKARLADGTIVTVPRANVEIIEG
jgi:hypothetical protein